MFSVPSHHCKQLSIQGLWLCVLCCLIVILDNKHEQVEELRSQPPSSLVLSSVSLEHPHISLLPPLAGEAAFKSNLLIILLSLHVCPNVKHTQIYYHLAEICHT